MQVFKRTNQALPPTDGNLTPLAARTPGRRYEGIAPDPVTKEARECEYPDVWESQADAEATAWLAAKPALDKAITNAPILAQIEAKEKQMIRSISELLRAREIGDVEPAIVAGAKTRLQTLYDQREAIRAQLQP